MIYLYITGKEARYTLSPPSEEDHERCDQILRVFDGVAARYRGGKQWEVVPALKSERMHP